MVASDRTDLEDCRADGEDDHGDRNLDHRQRRDRPDQTLQELRQHRCAHHLGPWFHEEDGRIVVVENLDEHEDERGEQRRSQEREDDAPARLPPAGARGSPRPIELFADPRERRVHDDVREGQVAYAEGEHDPPDAPAEPVTDRTRDEKGPEEADPDDDPRGGARIEKDDREAPPEREARAISGVSTVTTDIRASPSTGMSVVKTR